jgi:predicted phosphodiesterase
MRIALISDIHGHRFRLEQVFADLDARGGADRILCLGDCCFGGPQPVATLHLLRQRCHAWLLGNHDLELIDPQRYAASGGWIREQLDRNLSELSPDDLAFLRSWPLSVRLGLPGGGDLLAFHALPEDPDFPLAQDVPMPEFAGRLAGHPARIHAAGHTHVQCMRQFPDGGLFINPGSVSIPLATFPVGPEGPHFISECHYAIVEVNAKEVSVQLLRLPGTGRSRRKNSYPAAR